jgi:hypothetical protein
MKKKLFMPLILAVTITSGIFAQQIERLTYEEFNAGMVGRTVTVEAFFMGFLQNEVFLEGDLQVIYQCAHPYNGQWSDWKLLSKQPAIALTIRQTYEWLQKDYFLHPRAGSKVYINGVELVQIMAIPDGQSSPMWWSTNGRSFFVFYKLYAIKP